MKYALLFDRIGKRLCLLSALFLVAALFVPPYIADVEYAGPSRFLTHFSWSYEKYSYFMILFSAVSIYWNLKDKRERLLIISIAQTVSAALVIKMTEIGRYSLPLYISDKIVSLKFTPYYGTYLLQIGAIVMLIGAILREYYDSRIKRLLEEEKETADNI